ncbi:sperm receptor for egg jelly-like [Oculina patagonica]
MMQVVLLVFVLWISCVCEADNFGMVEPFPENIYAVEFSRAKVTCVAFDSSGVKVPEKIKFVRRDEFNRSHELTANDNLYFTNRTEEHDNKTKIFVTLHFRNITMEDDGIYGALGSYECHAFAVGDPVARARHGFGVIVIQRSEIPQIVVSESVVLEHDDNVTITCNVTDRGHPAFARLKRISWLKNGVVLYGKTDLVDPVLPLIREKVVESDEGNYTCVLEVLWRNIKSYNVTDYTFIKVKARPLKCYSCLGSGQKCRDEVVSKNSSAQVVCKVYEDRCFWRYQRVNSSMENFVMGCNTKQNCEKLQRSCMEGMSSNLLECCDTSSCNSDFCNKLSYTDGSLCKRRQNLVAIIYGGAEVIRGLTENITMNGSLSYDPETGDNKGMNFTWRYGSIPRNNKSSLHLLKQSSFPPVNLSAMQNKKVTFGRIISINTNATNGSETFVFTLTVAKGYRTASAIQVVHLVKGDPPRIYQRCLINCGPKLVPSVKLSIETVCQGSQCSNITSYNWILYQGNQSNPIVWKRRNDLQLITSTPLNSSWIVIKESSLIGGKNYRLAVLVTNAHGFAGISAYDFTTSLPPGGGTCTIEPKSGISLRTYFHLSCSGWTSYNFPLSYQFQYQLYKGLKRLVYYGLNTSVVSLLPSGDMAHNFTLNFTVTVTDSTGASTTYVNLSAQGGDNLPTTVRPFKDVTSNTIQSHLDDLDQMDDLNRAVQIANTILRAISRHSTLDRIEKTKTKELIVQKIATFQVKTLPDLLQSSSVLGSATQDTETVSEKTLVTSLSSIDSMTSLLMSKAKAKNVVDIPLITKSAENLGSCLNNMLKVGAVIASRNSDSGQGKHLVKRCMHLVSTVSDAVLETRLPDEEVISIQTSGMAFMLGRHTPSKLAGLKIESDNGKFVLPAESNVLVSRVANNSFVDTQMLSIPFNPFAWDKTRERVDSNVLSLDLKDDEQQVVEIEQLSSDVIIEIPLNDQSQPVKMSHFFTKNNSFSFHVVKVDYENTIVNLDIAPEDKSMYLDKNGSRLQKWLFFQLSNSNGIPCKETWKLLFSSGNPQQQYEAS